MKRVDFKWIISLVFLSYIEETIARHRYPVEIHKVTTSDGYILGVARVPKHGRTPALLVHGLLFSSAEWCTMGKHSLAMHLFDGEFDVWLMNARGNTFSRRHNKLSAKSEQFWDFSWHEIGMRDLPAVIDYVLSATGFQTLHYIGHSQGTTAFFVMTSSIPIYNSRIKTAHLLAPTAMMEHAQSPTRALVPTVKQLRALVQAMGLWELFGRSGDSFLGATFVAINDAMPAETFMTWMYSLSGMRPLQINHTLIKRIMETTPAGASFKQFEHYSQSLATGKFRQFDYGALENRARYNASKPPDYSLERVSAPLALYYSDNDWFVAVEDVALLKTRLSNVIVDYHVTEPLFNHVDFLFDMGAINIYEEIVRVMKEQDGS